MTSSQTLTVIPVAAPVKAAEFDLIPTIIDAIEQAQEPLQPKDILAISSKYAAISQGRLFDVNDITVSERAADLAARYMMDAKLTELVVREADHIFGGIIHEFGAKRLGFLLTFKDGIVSANAGIDRSNVPDGKIVLFPRQPYQLAAEIRTELGVQLDTNVGVILTDSWLMPGRIGTTGVALATAGFRPVVDERGTIDLFGNPMQVTQRGLADQLAASAQVVMGEAAEGTPLVILRGSGANLNDDPVSVDDVAIDWQMDLYVGALTDGLLPDGAPQHSTTQQLLKRAYSTEA